MTDKKSALNKKIYEFVQSKPVWFCILYLFIFVVLGYKVFSVVVLKDTGLDNNWSTGFLKLSLSLLSIIFIKEIYSGNYSFNFKRKGLLQGLLLGWVAWLFLIFNLCVINYNGKLNWGLFFSVMVCNFFTGLFEEVTMRGIILPHMIYKFDGEKNCIIKAVFWSSLMFGVLHLGNLIQGNYVATILQVFYATAIGMIFSAIYLLTKSLWSVIIMHWLIDFAASLEKAIINTAEQYTVNADGLFQFFLVIGLAIISFIVAIYFLRKKNRNKICEMWAIKESE